MRRSVVVDGMVHGMTPPRFARDVCGFGCAPDAVSFNGLTLRPFPFSPVQLAGASCQVAVFSLDARRNRQRCLICVIIINLKCVSRDPGVLLRAAIFTTGYVRFVGQEPTPSKCELVSTSRVIPRDMRDWVLTDDGDMDGET